MNIYFNKGWEAENWYLTRAKEVPYGLPSKSRLYGLGDIPEEASGIISGLKNKDEALSKIQCLLDDFLKTQKARKILNASISKAKERWNENGEYCLETLSKIMDIPRSSFEKEYIANFTFSKRCPFHKNEHAFMFNHFSDFVVAAAHEIMHIEFLKAYSEYCEKLGLNDEQINHLKEILTVILNKEMRDYFVHPDYGYSKHKEIRKEILEIYNKQEYANFAEFLKIITPINKTA